MCSKSHLHSGGNGKSKSSYSPPESLKLVQAEINNDPSKYDEIQRKAIESLIKLEKASNDTKLMNELFNEVDEDGSGLIGNGRRCVRAAEQTLLCILDSTKFNLIFQISKSYEFSCN